MYPEEDVEQMTKVPLRGSVLGRNGEEDEILEMVALGERSGICRQRSRANATVTNQKRNEYLYFKIQLVD